MYSHCHKSIEVVRFNIRSLPVCLPTPSSSYASASSPSHSSHIYVASFDWWCFSHRPGVSHSDKNRPAKRSAVHSSTYGSPSRLIVMVARLFCAMHCVHGVCLHPSEQWTRMNRTRQCACTCRYLPLIFMLLPIVRRLMQGFYQWSACFSWQRWFVDGSKLLYLMVGM